MGDMAQNLDLQSSGTYMGKVDSSDGGSVVQRVADDQSTGTYMGAFSDASSVINRVADDQSTGTYMGKAMSEASSVVMRVDNDSSDQSGAIKRVQDNDDNVQQLNEE